MRLEARVAHGVEEIGQEAWDRLSGGRPFTSYRWYQFGEKVRADDTPIYIIVSCEGEDVARATLWLTQQEPLPISMKPARYVMETLARRWSLLIGRSPLAGASGLVLPDPPLREAALEIIAQAAQEEARRHQALFLAFVYLEEDEAKWMSRLAAFVAVELPEAGTHLSITWDDFEGYLKQLPKSARQHYRRTYNHASKLGIEVKQYSTAAAFSNEALALIRNVEKRFNEPPYPWTSKLLEHSSMVDAVWLAAEVNKRLVGCGVVLKDGTSTMTTALGLDYSLQYVYFQLCYAGIGYATHIGAHDLWWGAGAYDVKQRLGFKLTSNTYSAFVSRSTLLQKVGHWLAKIG